MSPFVHTPSVMCPVTGGLTIMQNGRSFLSPVNDRQDVKFASCTSTSAYFLHFVHKHPKPLGPAMNDKKTIAGTESPIWVVDDGYL